MKPDVSVIIPAFQAETFIARAVTSVHLQSGIRSEIVIAADDDIDYSAVLAAEGIDIRDVVQCRTSQPQSGPSAARNLAASMVNADLIACLDADDAFEDGRLVPLAALADRHGAATGPTVEIGEGGTVQRTAGPKDGQDRLTPADIASVRMPYFPVFQRELFGAGWPDIAFAEDMIFNLHLVQAADTYAFSDAARYAYFQHGASLTNAPDALVRAITAYRQILGYLDDADWSDVVKDIARSVIQDDLAAAEETLSASGQVPASWRDAMARSVVGPGDDG